MGSHPVNLAVRFLLELVALAAMGIWGWQHGEGAFRFVVALAVPVTAAMLWGVFAVPGDPSRSGSAPLPVSGRLRLGLEAAFFAFATWGLYQTGHAAWWVGLGLVVVVHYAVSYDRIGWLMDAR